MRNSHVASEVLQTFPKIKGENAFKMDVEILGKQDK